MNEAEMMAAMKADLAERGLDVEGYEPPSETDDVTHADAPTSEDDVAPEEENADGDGSLPERRLRRNRSRRNRREANPNTDERVPDTSTSEEADDDPDEGDAPEESEDDVEGDVYYRNVDDDDVPEHLRGFKYYAKAEDGTDLIRFKDDDALYQGAVERERIVRQQRSRIKELETAQAQQAKDLAFYESHMPEDQMVANLVEEMLPEEYKGKTREDFLDDDDALTAFIRATVTAEDAAKAKIAEMRESQVVTHTDAQEVQQKALDAASKLLSSKAFGLTGDSTSDETLAAFFKEEMVAQEGGDPLDPLAQVTYIHALLGPEMAQKVADSYIDKFKQRQAEGYRRVRRKRIPQAASSNGIPKKAPKPYADMSGDELLDDEAIASLR